MDIYDKFIRTIVDFPIEGIKFRDITPLLSNGEAFHQVIMDLNKELPSYENWDKIIAAESRGFVFASPLAAINSKGLVLARKKGKLPKVGFRESYALEYGEATIEIPDGAINPGDKVIILDDLIATGGSAKAMVNLVKKAGGIPIMALFLIELRSMEGYKKLGIPTVSIVNYGLHAGDLLQVESHKGSFAKFVNKIDDENIEVEFENGQKEALSKSKIISIVQIEKNGRQTYIKYRD